MSLLSKKDVRKCWANWMTYALACQNMERMMAPAFVRMFGTVANKLYRDNPEKQKELLYRHSQFFNTEESAGSIIPGIMLGMEEKKAEGEDISDEAIQSTKTALMGPFAGIGDSLLGGTFRPILCSVAMGLCAETGSVIGPLFYCVVWLMVMIPGTYFLFTRGYKLGIDAANVLFAGGKKDIITRMASILGLFVVGAITAQYVTATCGWSYVSGDMTITLQGILDSILPNMLSIGLTLFAWWLFDKKQMTIGKIFVVFIIIALVSSLSGLLVVA